MIILKILFATVEPVTVVMIYNSFNNIIGNKKFCNISSFIILYCSILLKQYRMNLNKLNVITLFVMILPILISFILPRAIYKVYNTYLINKALIAFLALSLSVDCIILFTFCILPSTPSNSLIELLFTLVGKILQLIILKWLLTVIRCQEHEIIYITICILLILMNHFVTDFILTERIYKYFGFLITLSIVSILIYLLRSLSIKLQKFGSLKGLKHDENSHYVLMQQMVQNNKEEELQKYNEEIKKELSNNKYCVCDNFVISSIINKTLESAKKHQINFQYKIETCFLPLNSFEQNTIIKNILNNAIESCISSAEKIIDFSIKQNYFGEIVLKCVNSCSTIQDGYKLSRKGKGHGIGLENVNRIINRNGGTFYYGLQEDKTFLVLITLK